MARLEKLDLTKSIDSKDYKQELKKLQLELLDFQLRMQGTKRTLILLFEGPDAAGKGGVIKRIVERLDPRRIRVYSIVKPTPEEYEHHYMWRFWNKMPRQGEIAIFDRSWYGRVLVERVEGFCSREEWKRAYEEINHFERLIVDGGAILCKFYIHISKKEQLQRFEARANDPYKRWKINEEDWRNREKWELHNEAAEDMFDKTDTPWSPWHLIEGNFKWHSRIKVLKTVSKHLQEAMKNES